MRRPHPVRLGWLLAVAAAAVAVASCPEPRYYPGALVANFILEGTPAPGGVAECMDAGYTEIPAPDGGFSFSAIYSGAVNGQIDWLTLGEYVRDAGFDGRFIHSTHSAPRSFRACFDAGVDEEFILAPLSLSQSEALQGVCPQDPLSPGAIPVDEDAGILPPGYRNGTFDAVRACGVLRDSIRGATDEPCRTCTMTFSITGIRI
ncbi:MAG TPA: hypothetical protein VND93_26955 [Myxococcales bacterium]|nr:hypothetical protein [Myxococcales bacterium]